VTVRRLLVAALALVALCALAGCPRSPDSAKEPPAGDVIAEPPDADTNTQPAEAAKPSEMALLAAASLTDCFDELSKSFEAQNTGARVKASYAGTQELKVQLEQGAKCDVFASASKSHMDDLVKAGLVTDAQKFATNELCVVADKKDARVKSIKDLASKGVHVVVAVDTCPAGKYTRRCWDKMKADPAFGADFVKAVEANVVSEETNVKLVVSKVAMGEADAAFVYVSDARGEDVTVIELPASVQVEATYMVGIGKEAASPDLARAYIDLLMGPEGAKCLQDAGLKPAGGAAERAAETKGEAK